MQEGDAFHVYDANTQFSRDGVAPADLEQAVQDAIAESDRLYGKLR